MAKSYTARQFDDHQPTEEEISSMETLFRQKFKNKYHEIRRMFVLHDPQLKGNISRDSLFRVIAKIMSRRLTDTEMAILLNRLGFRTSKMTFSLTEFSLACNTYSTPQYDSTTNSSTSTHRNAESVVTRLPTLNYSLSRSQNLSLSPSSLPIYSNRKATSTLPEEFIQNCNVVASLRRQFCEGMRRFYRQCKTLDEENLCFLTFEQFSSVLRQNQVDLPSTQINSFLTRYNIYCTEKRVGYLEVLNVFLNRELNGILQRRLDVKSSRYGKINGFLELSEKTDSFRKTEDFLLVMFHRQYCKLRALLESTDEDASGFLSPQQFRSALESMFPCQFSASDYRELLRALTTGETKPINYSQFLKLFHEKDIGACIDTNVQYDVPRAIDRQPLEEINNRIASIFANKLSIIDTRYMQMEEYHTKKLSEHTLFKLLEGIDAYVTITREDIAAIWPTLMVGHCGFLAYNELIRHFLYKPDHAAFPNSKYVRPLIGDADLMSESNTLNSDRDLLHGALAAQLSLRVHSILKKFLAMDGELTGYVDDSAARNVLHSICPELQYGEVVNVLEKFRTRLTGKINYLKLLKPYAVQKWNIPDLTIDIALQLRSRLMHSEKAVGTESSLQLPHHTIEKLRCCNAKLLSGCQKLDGERCGFIKMGALEMLLKTNVQRLTNEERRVVYDWCNLNHTDRLGQLNYKVFLGSFSNTHLHST